MNGGKRFAAVGRSHFVYLCTIGGVEYFAQVSLRYDNCVVARQYCAQ